MTQKLKPSALRWKFKNFDLVKEVLRRKRSKKLGKIGAMSQERAVSALELGFGIKQRGFNIFVVGASGTGRTSTVKQMLSERAIKEPTPDDIALLYNFADRNRPIAVSIPPSTGPKLKKTYDTLVDKMLNGLEKALEDELYLSTKQQIQDHRHQKTDEVLQTMEADAKEQGFVLSRAAGSLTLTPAGTQGIAITEDEFEALPDDSKEKLEVKAERLETRLEDVLRKIRVIEKEGDDAIEKLERETANQVIEPLFDNAKAQWKASKPILAHLESTREDVLNRIRRLIPDEIVHSADNGEPMLAKPGSHKSAEDEEEIDQDEPVLIRYRVNVLVTHAKNSGSPIVQETHPTSSNLIGRIEQKLRAGETITDFTRIRAGALFKANGGYLVLEAQDLLRDPAAWEGLKRALKNRAVELDDPGEPGRMIAIASIRPEPVPLSLKVVLIGTPDLYYALSKNDPEFGKLFKVKADFDMEMDRSEERMSKYLHFLVTLCRDEKLRQLTPEGAGRVMEHAVRLAAHQKKLTARLGDIADLLREANFWAGKEKDRHIDAHHVRQALKARSEREGFVETHMIDDVLTGRVTIETSGEVIGQCNALTVVELGSYEFGVPLRVTCRIGCGRGELIDIEREAELGGPIHTKGTMIIRGLLADRFGRDIALGLSATICMEQTYSDVDGDSASLAEACTLFSMLANAPIAQRFAITGSIDQRGIVQTVGGINEKIEGFFNICSKRDLKKCPGVILPSTNVPNIMLNEEVVQACKNDTFTIYAVDTLEQAIELLTGRSWSKGDNPLRQSIFRTLEHLQSLRSHQHSITSDSNDLKAKLKQLKPLDNFENSSP